MNDVNIISLHDFKKAPDINEKIAHESPSYGSAYAELTVNGLSMDVGFNFENGKVTETSFDYDDDFGNQFYFENLLNGKITENVAKDVKSAISESFEELYQDAVKDINIKNAEGTDYQFEGIRFSAVAGEGTELETEISGKVYGGSIHQPQINGSLALSDLEEDIVNAVQREPFKDYPHVSSFEDIMFSDGGSRNTFVYPQETDISSLEDFGIATAIFDNGMVASFSFTNNGVGFETDFENGTDEFRENNKDAVGDISDTELEDLMIGMSENLHFEFDDFMKEDIEKGMEVEITESDDNQLYFRGVAGKDLPGEFAGVAEVKENGDLFIDPQEIETSGVLNPYLLSESPELKNTINEDLENCLELSCEIENVVDDGKNTTFEGHLSEPLDAFSFSGTMDNNTKNVSINENTLIKPSISHWDVEEAVERDARMSDIKQNHVSNKNVEKTAEKSKDNNIDI